MKQTLILLFFLLTGIFVFSQDNDADSLLNVLKNSTEDTSKVNTFNELFKYYQIEDADKAFEYATKAYNLAEKLNFKKGMGSSLNNIGMYYFNLDSSSKALVYFSKANDIFTQIEYNRGKAIALANIGNIFFLQDNYSKALEYFYNSLTVAQAVRDSSRVAKLMGNIGVIYYNQGYFSKALDLYFKSLKIRESMNDMEGAARVYGNIGVVYDSKRDYEKSLEYYNKSLEIQKEIGDKKGFASSLINIGQLYRTMGDKKKAIENLLLALKINTEIENKNGISACLQNIGDYYIDEKNYSKALEYFLKADELNSELNDKKAQASTLGLIGDIYFAQNNYTKALEQYQKSVDVATEIGIKDQLKEDFKHISEVYIKMGNYEMAYEYQKQYSDIKDSIYTEESINQIADMQTKYETEKQEEEIKLLKKETELKDLRISRGNLYMFFVAGICVLILILGSLTFYAYRQNKKAKKILEIQNREIIEQKEEITLSKAELEKEKTKSDSLLLNILPYDTAEELKTKGYSTVQHFQNVSVMFTDFVDFTRITESLKPSELVEELNIFFYRFDEIITRYNLEKIKTIGDSYMCASGMHSGDSDSTRKIILAAFELLNYVNERNTEKKKNGDLLWEIRIGIHTGDVIAGVVGKKKFAYDIWGDTVNTASRMESSGAVGKINISGNTFNRIQNFFNCEYRGKIDVKNKNNIDMYFVESIKNEIMTTQ
ncbi:MAG: adenylate/guanylate cyclase domain-containing protein [Bacteroidota bacterium]